MTSKIRNIQVAVGMDDGAWHEKFANALDEKVKHGFPLDYKVVNSRTK